MLYALSKRLRWDAGRNAHRCGHCQPIDVLPDRGQKAVSASRFQVSNPTALLQRVRHAVKDYMAAICGRQARLLSPGTVLMP